MPEFDEENARLSALTELAILDTPEEACYNDIVEIAALVCGVPISLVSLLETDRQWFKANKGLEAVTQTPREVAFCSYTIQQDGLFEINDASQDPRFAANPLVTDSPNIRFYAGATLRLKNGARVGTLCVIDDKPKFLSADQRNILSRLSACVVRMLEARLVTANYAESEARFRALSASAPLGVFSTTADGACTYTNERWQDIFGISSADSLGVGWSETLHPEDKNAVYSEWQRSSAIGADFDMNFRIQRADGSIASVRAVSRPVLTAEGTVSGHVGSVEDITEHSAQQEALRKSEILLAQTGELAEVGGWDLDVSSHTLMWTDQTFRIHDLAVGENPTLEQALSFYTDDSRPIIENAISLALNENKEWDLELPIVTATGRPIWIRSVGSVEQTITKSVRLIGAVQNITDRVLQRQALEIASNELARQHELLSVTLQCIGDAVITTDTNGCINWLNPVAGHLTGWTSSQARGNSLSKVFKIIHEGTRKPVPDPIQQCIDQRHNISLPRNNLLISRRGQEFAIEGSAAPINSTCGALLGSVLVFHDVSKQRQLNNEMSYRAMHDTLTGLINRSEFESRLQRTLDNIEAHGTPYSLLYVDLDQFKLVNDSCGHSRGDKLLIQISNLMSDIIQCEDSVARIGGDEFALILKDRDTDQAREIAQNICDSISEIRFVHEERRFRIGTSIGVVYLDDQWINIEAAMQAADISCYTAKAEGRNRVHVWYDTDVALQARREGSEWAARIEQALEEDRFELHAQQIHPLGSQSDGVCAEVLIRMRGENGRLIYPERFIAAAERFNLATRIDRWVLQNGINALQDLSDINDVRTLFINLSGQSVGDRVFHKEAIKLLTSVGGDICRRLCLEITETAAVTNIIEASTFVDDVRKLGVKVALDDFGAGASSFGYLKTLKVDLLKIDGQFTEGVVDDPLDGAAIRCFVDVAKVMGIKTIAEYVSDAEIMDCLLNIGVDYAQGFYLHKPEPLKQALCVSPNYCQASAEV